jgi:ankyrin repeat protein
MRDFISALRRLSILHDQPTSLVMSAVENGADLNARNAQGETLLHLACLNGFSSLSSV